MSMSTHSANWRHVLFSTSIEFGHFRTERLFSLRNDLYGRRLPGEETQSVIVWENVAFHHLFQSQGGLQPEPGWCRFSFHLTLHSSTPQRKSFPGGGGTFITSSHIGSDIQPGHTEWLISGRIWRRWPGMALSPVCFKNEEKALNLYEPVIRRCLQLTQESLRRKANLVFKHQAPVNACLTMVHYQLLCGGSDSKGVYVCLCVSVGGGRHKRNGCNDSLSAFWKADFEVACIIDCRKTIQEITKNCIFHGRQTWLFAFSLK